jgi:hypothetical protein
MQAFTSVVVQNETLEHHGQAGYVVGDKTKLVNGVTEGTVEVKMDVDNEVYEFNVGDVRAL